MALSPRLKNFGFVLGLCTTAWTAFSAENANTLPEEYLSTGEQSTALANGGSLSSGGFSAVRANPAMLSANRQYTLGGGYHWPTRGRNFYQAGVVDAKTAAVAAGLSYTSSLDDYEGSWQGDGTIEGGDSPVKRRVAVGLAHAFKNFSLGVSGGFIETADPAQTFDEDADRVRGVTLGAGAVVGLLSNLRAGLSVENLANKKVSTLRRLFTGQGSSGVRSRTSAFILISGAAKLLQLMTPRPLVLLCLPKVTVLTAVFLPSRLRPSEALCGFTIYSGYRLRRELQARVAGPLRLQLEVSH